MSSSLDRVLHGRTSKSSSSGLGPRNTTVSRSTTGYKPKIPSRLSMVTSAEELGDPMSGEPEDDEQTVRVLMGALSTFCAGTFTHEEGTRDLVETALKEHHKEIASAGGLKLEERVGWLVFDPYVDLEQDGPVTGIDLTKWDEKTRTGSIQFSLDGSFSVGDDQETKWWFTPVKVKLQTTHNAVSTTVSRIPLDEMIPNLDFSSAEENADDDQGV